MNLVAVEKWDPLILRTSTVGYLQMDVKILIRLNPVVVTHIKPQSSIHMPRCLTY
jgi:hypothetical protein